MVQAAIAAAATATSSATAVTTETTRSATLSTKSAERSVVVGEEAELDPSDAVSACHTADSTKRSAKAKDVGSKVKGKKSLEAAKSTHVGSEAKVKRKWEDLENLDNQDGEAATKETD